MKAREAEKAKQREHNTKHQQKLKENGTFKSPTPNVFPNLTDQPHATLKEVKKELLADPETRKAYENDPEARYQRWASSMDHLWRIAEPEWREKWMMING